MQLGVREAHLGCARRALLNCFGSATATFLPLALSLGIRVGATLSLGIRFRFGLRFQALPRRFDRGSALLAALQLLG
jgi:hypothetical protein